MLSPWTLDPSQLVADAAPTMNAGMNPPDANEYCEP